MENDRGRVSRAAVALLLLGCAVSVHAAGPRAIMFHGGSLEQAVFLTDWARNVEFMRLIVPAAVDPAALEGRPSIEYAFFSAPQWEAATTRRRPLADVRPEEGTPTGRFYPATAATGALLVATWPRRAWTLSPEALGILQQAGVPTRQADR